MIFPNVLQYSFKKYIIVMLKQYSFTVPRHGMKVVQKLPNLLTSKHEDIGSFLIFVSLAIGTQCLNAFAVGSLLPIIAEYSPDSLINVEFIFIPSNLADMSSHGLYVLTMTADLMAEFTSHAS